MKFDDGTVFILGAGFTKAFLREAPVLVDDYDVELLKHDFSAFSEAVAVLENEVTHPANPPGLINLERLMTRLHGGMPYDFRTGAEGPFALLLSELKRRFIAKLQKAWECGTSNPALLWLFAGHCVASNLKCITFNYDDLLDEALWRYRPVHDALFAWSPDWGYGFPCRISEACVRDVGIHAPRQNRALLLKLHGSLNWRVAHGQPKPYTREVPPTII